MIKSDPAMKALPMCVRGLLWHVMIATVIACVLPAAAAAAQTRPPNEWEQAYTAIALDTGMHDLCAKISPNARARFGFNSPGTQIYHERSRCLLYVAVNTQNPYLCREIVEARGWFLDGSYFSKQNCETLVAEGRAFNFSVTFDHRLILTEMGYDEAHIRAKYPGETAEIAYLEFYLGALGRDGDFQQRLLKLPDFSGQ